MEIEGGGRVHVYGPEDEAAHTPGPQPHWQESVVLIWWDARRGVGGYHRIGHEPNHDGGHAVLWHNLFTPQGVHRRNHVLPLRPEDRLANGFGGGRDGYRFEYAEHLLAAHRVAEVARAGWSSRAEPRGPPHRSQMLALDRSPYRAPHREDALQPADRAPVA